VPSAISNTSPLLYLHRIGALDWLPKLFSDFWVPQAVVEELREGRTKGHDAPRPEGTEWIQIVEPRVVPSEWLVFDLGPGELAALALGLEHRDRIILLDDAMARRIGQAAGLTVWGTLRVLLEAKSAGLTSSVAPLLEELEGAGMWMSQDIRQRVLSLAGELSEPS
jgi:predicted nucleic acid-binding protein